MNSNSDIQQFSIFVTKHACKRARKRYRWNSDTLKRMAIKAFDTGLRRNNTAGYLKIYLDKKFEKYERTNNLRVYGETVFVFVHNHLVTVWTLPVQLRPLAKVFRLKYEKSKMAVKSNCAVAVSFMLLKLKETPAYFSEEIYQNVSAVFDYGITFCA
jgi:hypothetical protein